MIKQKIFIDMDDTLCQYSKAWKLANDQGTEFPQSKEHFFEYLQPIKGAITAVEQLSNNYDVWILTAPSIYNPSSYIEKRLWVDHFLGFEMCKKLIICPNKGLISGNEKYIDTKFDKYDTIVTHILIDDLIEGKGQENWTGDLMQFGSKRYPNWDSICKTLLGN